MKKSVQKRFDRADVVRDVRFALPVQTVDATLSNPLIRQSFPGRSGLFGCTRSKPSQGSVPAIYPSERFSTKTLPEDRVFRCGALCIFPEWI